MQNVSQAHGTGEELAAYSPLNNTDFEKQIAGAQAEEWSNPIELCVGKKGSNLRNAARR